MAWAKKNGSREGLRLPSASPLLGIEASGTFTEEPLADPVGPANQLFRNW